MKAKCEECTLGRTPVPMQAGRVSLMLVGQAPGRTETLTKVPFTGPAGRMLWRLCKEAGLDKPKLYVTNVVACAPPDDRMPTPKEVVCCLPRLIEEIEQTRPKVIVALGDLAITALTGEAGKAQRLRGQVLQLRLGDHRCPVVCTLHPAFVMRQRQWIDVVVNDLRQAKLLMEDNVEIVREEPELILDPPVSQLAETLDSWSTKMTAFDIETPGELNPRKAEIIGIAFSGEPHKAVAVDLYPGCPSWDVVRRFLEDGNAKKIAQNATFDLACLETSGVHVQGLIFDTRLAEYVMSSGTPTSLEFLRSKYTKVAPYKPAAKQKIDTIRDWPKEERLRYNALDAAVTLLVAIRQWDLLDPQDWGVLHKILLPLVPVINRMERKGVLVDQSRMLGIAQELHPKIEHLEKTVFEPCGINPASPKQVAAYLSIDSTGEAELLRQLKLGHEKKDFIEALLQWRKLTKLMSVYIVGVWDRLENGRIHTRFKIGGTETGRLASENPNLQNVPQEMRCIYIADPGMVMIGADYSQLELRVLAIVAGEEQAIRELFYEGRNTHHIMGKIIFGKEWDELTIEERLKAKGVVFGTAYGRSARSIASDFGISLVEAEVWQQQCINRYPGFLRYREQQQRLAGGIVTTPFGRKRRVETLAQALNTPIQSAGADVCLTSLIELDKAGFDLRLTVHDSIVLEAPEQEADEAMHQVKAIMERPILELGGFSFPVKIKKGKTWGEV